MVERILVGPRRCTRPQGDEGRRGGGEASKKDGAMEKGGKKDATLRERDRKTEKLDDGGGSGGGWCVRKRERDRRRERCSWYRAKARARSALVREATAAREETSRPASVSGMLGAAIVILPPFHRAPIT